jgi:hypothetical protein
MDNLQLLSFEEYSALSEEAAIEYEESIVQLIYDTLYSVIKSGQSTHEERLLFLKAADQYNLTWNEAEETFFHRRLHQLHVQHPELHELLKKY